MVAHQHPRIAGRLCFGQDGAKALEEIYAVGAVFKDRFSFNAAHNYMMQCSARIYTGFAWHGQ
jgi:hypothetical protein